MYELCKISVDVFQPGEVKKDFFFQVNYPWPYYESKTCWFTEKKWEESVVDTGGTLKFNECAYYLSFTAIGLDGREGTGDLDALLEHGLVKNIFDRKTLKRVVDYSEKLIGNKKERAVANIRFIGVFEHKENTWQFIGVLPLDDRLMTVVLSDI